MSAIRTEITSDREAAAPEQWRKALLPTDATLQQAIQNLDGSMLQIALVATPDCRLVGTLTDGDIRRGLLRGLDLTSSVDTIIQRHPLVVPPEMGSDTVLQLMQANKIHQLPVVAADRRILGLHVWSQLVVPAERTNLMLILAGGRGTRLRPQTEHCPKPMLSVGGKPMLQHIIERASSEGFKHFALAIHFLGHLIEDYFGDGSNWKVQIDYIREKSPLGTAGAVTMLNPRPDAPFVVTNGDVLTDIRYGEVLDYHRRHAATATMAVRVHEWQHPFGVVQTKGLDIIGLEEKPVARSHINAGMYVLDPSTVQMLEPGQPCDMPTLFRRLLERGARTIVYPMHEPWLDIGRIDDLERAQERYDVKQS